MRIGLGMAALGRPGYINLQRNEFLSSRTIDGMQTQANLVIEQLFNQCKSLTYGDGDDNIPWLDCARSYGLSEKFVGEYLRSNNIKPNEVYVSSKWGYTYVADWKVELADGAPHEVKDHSLENFLKQVEETKEHIGEYLNLYQVHSATFESGILSNRDVHNALQLMKEEKGCKIGLSVSGPNQDELIREAMQIKVKSGEEQHRLFDSVQCTYNILEQRPATALQEAHAEGLDIIIKEGMANARALKHPILLELAAKLGCKPDQLALAAILAQPFKPRVLSGAVNVEQLRSNLGAMYPIGDDTKGVVEKLTSTKEGKEILQQLMESCRMESEEYWKNRSDLKWN